MLARHPKTLFVGQSVAYPGQLLHKTLRDVPQERRIEMPVVEDFQMGFCTGLALEHFIPICIFPRWDFLILAANQLVNHLDKLPYFYYRPKLIIRTAVGDNTPLDPGPQHTGDYTEAFKTMLDTVEVIDAGDEPYKAYERAFKLYHPCLVVERMASYR